MTTITMTAIGYRMSDVAQGAETIRQLALDAQQAIGDSETTRLAALICAIGSVAATVGVLADMTAADVGATPTLGDASEWLLTPAERQEAASRQ